MGEIVFLVCIVALTVVLVAKAIVRTIADMAEWRSIDDVNTEKHRARLAGIREARWEAVRNGVASWAEGDEIEYLAHEIQSMAYEHGKRYGYCQGLGVTLIQLCGPIKSIDEATAEYAATKAENAEQKTEQPAADHSKPKASRAGK
jgi:hypothetical protein